MSNDTFYPDIEPDVLFPIIEKEILDYWENNDIFKKSLENYTIGEHSNDFVLYDGPPFANGLPHYGHLLTGFIKDVFARYQTAKGKKVERRFGWDCHGLPAEMLAEKELGFSGRKAISEYGIDKFNSYCRLSVMKYSSEWKKYMTRQARWVDLKSTYKTMDKKYMESVFWVFKELYKKGLIYESTRVMPYSWACETPLSNFETRMDNSYRKRKDKAVTVSFILIDLPENAPNGFTQYKMLAWTTTPWTLPANLALAVNADLNYVFVPNNDVCYIIAFSALNRYRKELNLQNTEIKDYRIIKGEKLIGIRYKPLFSYFMNHPNSFRVLGADFVLEGNGTGIVHIAPGFGEDDYNLCQQESIKLVCPVDSNGKFTKEVFDFSGMQVFEANDLIIRKIKYQGNWIKTEDHIHDYPHCWRTDTPLIYRAVPSWYVKVTLLKDRMIELNQKINWVPQNVRDGLFGKWLKNAKDWSISRNRFWGTPIPIWRSNNPEYPRVDVYGSCAELEKDFGVKIQDLHKPFIDKLIRPNPDDPTGKSIMVRVEDVFDCWFESGAMPYGQVHYPFENKELLETRFPADLVVEYSAQTRGWFYTLLVFSTALFDLPPFLNCVCHGTILDSNGQKLSKRLNNYVDPFELFDKYGADALRVTMLSSNVIKGQELLIDKDARMVFDSIRLFIKPIWNAFYFFCLYANLDKLKAQYNVLSNNILDRYILSKLKITVKKIENSMDQFDTSSAYKAISNFFEVLNNWYIRRSRTRFWKAEYDEDKLSAYNTLYTCLEIVTRAMSPLLPLISEKIYTNLTSSVSVHLERFPSVDDIIIEEQEQLLIDFMDKVLDICTSSLFIRSKENIRIRQPLNNLTIYFDGDSTVDYNKYIQQFETLIKDEVNVKSVSYKTNIREYASFNLSINFPLLGKRIPHRIKEIVDAVKAGDWQEENKKLSVSGIELLSTEYKIFIKPKEGLRGVKALSHSVGLVQLDLEITKELEEEGIVRDFIRFIQQARREAGFKVSDRIKLNIKSIPALKETLKKYESFITTQTLSKIMENFNSEYSTDVILNKCTVFIELAKDYNS